MMYMYCCLPVLFSNPTNLSLSIHLPRSWTSRCDNRKSVCFPSSISSSIWLTPLRNLTPNFKSEKSWNPDSLSIYSPIFSFNPFSSFSPLFPPRNQTESLKSDNFLINRFGFSFFVFSSVFCTHINFSATELFVGEYPSS